MSTPDLTTKGQATRERIVEVACELCHERGVGAMTLDDVQARAQVSRGQIYHYFAARSDLVHAVVEATTDRILEAQRDTLGALATWEGVEAWLAFLDGRVHAQRRPGGCPLGSLVGQLVPRDEGARRALAEGFARWEDELARGLRDLAARGELRDGVAPEDLAAAVMSAVQGGYVLTQVHADAERFSRALDGARAILRDARR